jgi:hypothetical protein
MTAPFFNILINLLLELAAKDSTEVRQKAAPVRAIPLINFRRELVSMMS